MNVCPASSTTEGHPGWPMWCGERTPHADPHARGAFAGLSMRHDRGALVRAVLEGVAFGLLDSLEGAAIGAAILGAVAAGIFSDVHEGVAATVQAGETIEPVPAWVEAYRAQRERYRALYPALRSALGEG